jgi:TolB-like protein
VNRPVLLLALLALPALAAPPPPPAAAKPVRVAVLYFDVLSQSAELQAFTKGFAAMMITDLAPTEGLTVLERDRLEAILAELKLGEGKFSDPSNLAKAGKLLNADFLVTGSIIKAANVSSVELKVFSVATSSIVHTSRAKMKDDDVFAAEQACVESVLKSLGKLRGALAAREPLPFPVAVKYSLALDAGDKKDTVLARRLLNELVAERPSFALPKLDLLRLTD